MNKKIFMPFSYNKPITIQYIKNRKIMITSEMIEEKKDLFIKSLLNFMVNEIYYYNINVIIKILKEEYNINWPELEVIQSTYNSDKGTIS